MKNCLALLFVAGCLLIASCASTKVSDLYEFYQIESTSESKLFGYRFVLDPAKRQPGTSRRAVSAGFDHSFSAMRDELEKYMDIFPYCIDGYFVYGENFDGEEYVLLGECQESK